MVKGIDKPNSQIQMFSIVAEELNGFRRSEGLPLVKFYLVIETNSNYPMHVYQVINTQGEISFELVKSVTNDDEYIEVMKV